MPPCRECRILYWPSSSPIVQWGRGTPDGSSIAGASTGLPGGHVLALAERRDAVERGERLDVLFHPALDDARDCAVALDQEHGRDARNAEGVGGGEAVVLAVEQGREGDAEVAVELAGVLFVVLGDAVDREAVWRVEAIQVRERHLADGAGDLEKGEQDGPVRDQVMKRGFAAVETGKTEFGRTCPGRQKISLPAAPHISSLPCRPVFSALTEGARPAFRAGTARSAPWLHSKWSTSLSGGPANVAPAYEPDRVSRELWIGTRLRNGLPLDQRAGLFRFRHYHTCLRFQTCGSDK